MIIKENKLSGVYEVTPGPHVDERGFFMRVYDKKVFAAQGIDREWVQENHSRSEKKGIIRGLHFQLPPFTETKLIRVVKGAIFDVFVDLRVDSLTFGKWGSIELSEENRKILFIPKGFAHGFCTQTEVSEVVYKVDNHYTPEAECGIIWDDPDLAVDWPSGDHLLSKKDSLLKTFGDFTRRYGGIKV